MPKTYADCQELLKEAVQHLVSEALLPVRSLPFTEEVRLQITQITRRRLCQIFWQLPVQLRLSPYQELPPVLPDA